MTCEEFRQTVREANPNEVTRAVRAVVGRHFDGCAACRVYLAALAARAEADGLLTDEDWTEIDAIAADDDADPEYQKARYGN